MDLHEIFGDRVDDMDEDRMDQAWIVTQVSEQVKEELLEEVEKVDRKVDSTVSTYDKLMENEDYIELPEKERILIWELVKIRRTTARRTRPR